MFFYNNLKKTCFYVFYFLMFFCVFFIALLFAFCFENIHTQNYKYDAIYFGKLR